MSIMIRRPKIRDLPTIMLWLLSLGKVADGKLSHGDNGKIIAKSMSLSQETITPQESTKGSLNYIPDRGGGTAYDDFDEDDEDDNIHRGVFKNHMLLYITVEYLI